VEKYGGKDCYCQKERIMEPRCEYDAPMERHRKWHHHHDGVDSMQIAMQYVPWQHWNHIYCPEEGLKCGTIFPELNKPFYGKGACRR
jgi:hypothetical protein